MKTLRANNSRWMFCVALAALQAAGAWAAERSSFDPQRRAPWTTSRVVGTPEPPPPYRLERVYPKLNFTEPVYLIAEPGSDSMLVVQRNGKIFRFADREDVTKPELYLDLGNESYSIAFHPKYAENGYLYVFRNLMKEGRNWKNRVSRFTVSRDEKRAVDPKSEQVVIEWLARGHNGGDMAFGADGMLYLTSGDGETGVDDPDPEMTGQDFSDLRSGILRIDVDRPAGEQAYGIPADNPFVGTPGARGELWAIGLRNPWRFCIDRESGQMYIGDNGEETWEAIYLGKRGANYGWSVLEGSHPFNLTRTPAPVPFEQPIAEHSHGVARSMIGGRVYHGPRLKELQGAYLYGDHETGKIWALRNNGNEVTWRKELVDSSRKIIAFGERHDRELLVVAFDGAIFRLEPQMATYDASQFPRKLSETGLFESVAEHRPAIGVIPYSINAPAWSDGARVERFMAVPGNEQIKFQAADGWEFPNGAVIVQSFSLPDASGQGEQRVETRLLHRYEDEWRGYSYRWNDEGTDAVLAPEVGATKTYKVAGSAGAAKTAEGPVALTWRFPSRAQCMVCHSFWGPRFVIGLSTPQMNRVHDYGGVKANQIEVLARLKILNEPPKDPTPKLAKLTDPVDASAKLDERARAYLHVNCAHCHRYSGAGNARMRLVYDAPDAETRIFDVPPEHGAFGLTDARLIAPGHPERSVLLYRMSKLGRGRMPHLGSYVVDTEGLKMIADWVRSRGEGTPAADPAAAAVKSLAVGVSEPAKRIELIEQALSNTSGAMLASAALDQGELDAATVAALVGRAATHPDRNVRDLFERLLPEEKRSKRLGDVIDPQQILALRGHAEQGERLFFGAAALQCKSCHQVSGKGVPTGPDLSRLTARASRRELLESVLEPSKFIDPKYQAQVIETVDGRVYLGLVVAKDAQSVVLKDAQNKEVRIPSDQIDRMEPHRKSLMPEGLLRDLTDQEAADLLEFVHSLNRPQQP